MNNTVLSIDQSTVKTGIAIFKENKFNKYDLIDLHKQKEERR